MGHCGGFTEVGGVAMRRIAFMLTLTVLAAAVGAGAAIATDSDGTSNPPALPAEGNVTVAQAPRVRLAGIFFRSAPTPGTVGILRSKGVQEVTNPAVGHFCIRPTAASGINTGRIVPVMSEWHSPASAGTTVLYQNPRVSCPAGTIEVVAQSDEGAARNLVGFTIIVP
jgi:hypothetical protein